jgi:hypothetical protein
MHQPPTLQQLEPFETFEARKGSRKSLLGFSLVYLTGYFTDPPALFHPELIHALELTATFAPQAPRRAPVQSERPIPA